MDLCHQSNDDEDDEEGHCTCDGLLPKIGISNSSGQRRIRCLSFRGIHVGTRQKLVILVGKHVQSLTFCNHSLSFFH